MERFAAYEIFKNGSMSRYICGPDLCKFYSRPVEVNSNLEEITDFEYESENEANEPLSRKKKTSKSKNSVSVATQTDYRENETQTDPWDAPYVVKKVFKEPEILQYEELTYGNGLPVCQTEIEYIVESRRNRNVETSTEDIDNYESFVKKKKKMCSQVQNEWNYKISKQNEKFLDKLKQMEIALIKEMTVKSERQEKLLKNLCTQKKEQMAKMNSKLQKQLNKELKILEKRSKSGTHRFDMKSQGTEPISKELSLHIKKNKESLNRDIDYLLTKYHMNPRGLSKLTDWLERKRTDLYNEIPVAKPAQKNQREKLVEKAYQELLVKKKTKMPAKIYREDYEKEGSTASSVKTEVEFEILELPEEGVDLVTVWQQILRGRAYEKQMLELIEKQKDSLNILSSSEVLGKS